MKNQLWKFLMLFACSFFAAHEAQTSDQLIDWTKMDAELEQLVVDVEADSGATVDRQQVLKQVEEQAVLNAQRHHEEVANLVASSRITRQEITQGRNPAAVTPEEEAENQAWMKEFEAIWNEED